MKNDYEVRGEVTAIFLKYREDVVETLIDTADLPKAHSFPGRWSARYEKKTKSLYVKGTIDVGGKSTSIQLHRFLMDAPKGLLVDHIHHNTLDNRRSFNLRIANFSENAQNRSGAQKNSKSGVRGVMWSKKENRWHAVVKHKGKKVFFKSFEKKEEAIGAVTKARAELLPYSLEALSS